MWIILFFGILVADHFGVFAYEEQDEIGCTTDQDCYDQCSRDGTEDCE